MSKSFIADIAWIRRGVAKTVPEKIEIEKEDLKELLQGDGLESSNEDESVKGEEESVKDEDNASETQGVRGSATDLTEGLQKYKLEDYDKEEGGDTKKGPSLKGLAYYTSPLEDPYITRHADSDEEEEREDFEIKPSDNLVVVAKIVKEDASLEVYVYNEENEDWYLHHDYILDAPPLCLAPFNYDPGSEDKKGNLVAVGTMDSVINIWDLDIVNAMEPVLSLGQSSVKAKLKKSKKTASDACEGSSSKKSRKKRDGSAQFHTDAVLCLDWNTLAEHVLASGSADETIILWDLDEAKPSTVLSGHTGMIQSLQWHPMEKSIILSGTRKGQISVTDCRSSDTQGSPLGWSIGKENEVEKLLWNRFNPYCAFVASNDGKLRYIDTRKPEEFLFDILAHEGGVNTVSQSFKGLLTTVGGELLNVWKLEGEQLQHIYTHSANMGSINTCKFSPDSGTILVIGAEGEELVRVLDISKHPEVVANFNKENELKMETGE